MATKTQLAEAAIERISEGHKILEGLLICCLDRRNDGTGELDAVRRKEVFPGMESVEGWDDPWLDLYQPRIHEFIFNTNSVYLALSALFAEAHMELFFHPTELEVWPWGIPFSPDAHEVKAILRNLVVNDWRWMSESTFDDHMAELSDLKTELRAFLEDPAGVAPTLSRPGKVKKLVLDVVSGSTVMTPAEISQTLGSKGHVEEPACIRRACRTLLRDGYLKQPNFGEYLLSELGAKHRSG